MFSTRFAAGSGLISFRNHKTHDMKKLMILFVCAVLLGTGCSDEKEENGPEQGMVWDFITPSVAFRVENALGDNLFDSATEGNWLEREIHAEFRGRRYPMKNLTRETMPRELMLRLEYARSQWEIPGETVLLTFGEFEVYDTMEGEPLTIYWGDGTSDVVKIYLRLRWEKHDPVVDRELWLNGVRQPAPESGFWNDIRLVKD